MIFTTHLFLQWLEYFRAAQNSCELLGGKKQGIFGVWVTNQSASWVLSTDLVYAYYYYCYCKTLHDMSTDRVRLKKLFTSKIVQPSRPCFYYSGKDLWKRYLGRRPGEIHVLIFCFTMTSFFQNGPYFYTERFRKRNL